MKMLVLVRKDLSLIQRAVQAGHAIAEYLKNHRDTSWTNGTLVLMGVENPDQLLEWKERITAAGVSNAMFYEPDGDSHTALAYVHDQEDNNHRKLKRKLDSKVKLLSM